jgi:hypothetical protein
MKASRVCFHWGRRLSSTYIIWPAETTGLGEVDGSFVRRYAV